MPRSFYLFAAYTVCMTTAALLVITSSGATSQFLLWLILGLCIAIAVLAAKLISVIHRDRDIWVRIQFVRALHIGVLATTGISAVLVVIGQLIGFFQGTAAPVFILPSLAAFVVIGLASAAFCGVTAYFLYLDYPDSHPRSAGKPTIPTG